MGEVAYVSSFGPSSSGPCLKVCLALGVLGSPLGVCCHHDLFPFRATGLRRTDRRQAMSFFVCFLFFLCSTTFSFVLDTVTLNTLHRICSTCSRRRSPRILSILFLGFFAFCGVLLPLGWWGSPCCVLSPFFPWFWVVGLGISAISCTLASFFLCRLRLGKPGRPACKPPGPCRPFSWPVPPYPSPAGSRRRYGSRERAAG